MPNWCGNTNIYWTKEEYKDELEKLYELIKNEFTKYQNSDEIKLLWLKILLDKSGLNSNRYECRGYITGLGAIEKVKPNILCFEVDTDTAWRPIPGAMKALIRQYPHLHLAYCSEEPGAGIYVKKDYRGKFFTVAKTGIFNKEKFHHLQNQAFLTMKSA